MKWSTLLVTGSIGTRAGSVQLTPSDDFENTMSLDGQFLRAAVLPRDVDRPVAGDLGGRERARAQAARDAVEADSGDLEPAAPGRPAAVGVEGRDRAVQAPERDDDASPRQHDRLGPEAFVVPFLPNLYVPLTP